jgi:hypothetical protein
VLFGWFCLLGSSALAFQSVGPSVDGQVNPAPWRPAFGTDSQSAASSGAPSANLGAVNVPVLSSETQGDDSRTGQAPELGDRPTNEQPISTPRGANLPEKEGPGVVNVTQRMEKLPNSAGQIWREYDISPYTSAITNNDKPQQALIDWILLETGIEMWFNHPLGILNASQNQLYVYHTPEIQAVVRRIVDRFVRTRGQLQKLDVTLMTVENPNWRAQAYTMLQPIEVNSPGAEAWMISKENAALLQNGLSRRADAKLNNSGTLTNHDGQTSVLKKTQPVQFVRSLKWMPNQVPNYQPLMTNIEEGYSLEISCLSSLDNNTIEATIKCDVNQVERLSTVKVNLPGAGGNTQQMNLQIPQLVSWRLHERFRWPNDQVLMLSCGVVAGPEPDTPSGISLLGLYAKPNRVDALLFIEYRGPATGATVPRTADSAIVPIRPRQ